jgi:hypothetical protein
MEDPPPQLPPTEQKPDAAGLAGRNRRLVIAALLAFVAAGLAIISPFLPLFTGDVGLSSAAGLKLSVTGWVTEVLSSANEAGTNNVQAAAPDGYPLIFGGLLLLATAVAALRLRFGSAITGLPATRLLAGVAAAFLTGTVVTVGMQGIGLAGLVQVAGVSVGVGIGYWLLILAVLAALAAAVLVNLPSSRSAPPPDGVAVDVTTPRMGFPAPWRPPADQQDSPPSPAPPPADGPTAPPAP